MRILIIEDERVAARRLVRIISEILSNQLKSIETVASIDDAFAYLKIHSIDLLFLDLNLNGDDGFNILKVAVAESFDTIVVSANTDRAIEAFEYGVLDFIPKPFDKARLIKGFERLEVGSRNVDNANARILVIKNQGNLILVPVEGVIYLKGAGDYTEIHLKDETMALHNKTMEALSRILPKSMLRIHKSYITDITFIRRLNIFGGGKYECELHDGTVLPVSRGRYKEILVALETEST